MDLFWIPIVVTLIAALIYLTLKLTEKRYVYVIVADIYDSNFKLEAYSDYKRAESRLAELDNSKTLLSSICVDQGWSWIHSRVPYTDSNISEDLV